MAQWFAKGTLKEGDLFIHESIIGSQFTGRVEKAVTVAGKPAIVPSIEGWAKIYGYNTITIDPEDDPYAYRFPGACKLIHPEQFTRFYVVVSRRINSPDIVIFIPGGDKFAIRTFIMDWISIALTISADRLFFPNYHGLPGTAGGWLLFMLIPSARKVCGSALEARNRKAPVDAKYWWTR